MMSCASLTPAQAEKYFEHESEYYTKNLSNFDRWHGNLSETLGLKGECSKEQFDEVLKHIKESGRERAGVDCTFSAPKSVSLAMSKDEKTRLEMIEAHQKAVARVSDLIELKLLQTRSNKKSHHTMNMIAAEFMHEMARPTKANDFVPDLDLHSHLVILNETIFQGKNLSIDYEKVLDRQSILEYGLIYRQELAAELQKQGYELELTDEKNGFFELKGFDRETVLNYSHRRAEILETAQEHGITDMQKANQFSREKKSAGKANLDEVRESVRKDLFANGKINILKEENYHGNERNHDDEIAREYAEEREVYDSRNFELNGRETDTFYERHITNFADIANGGRFGTQTPERRGYLQDLPALALAQKSSGNNLLLSETQLSNLAKLTERKVRDNFVRQKNKERSRVEAEKRRQRIAKIGHETIKKMSAEKFAFTPVECRHRIMAAGTLERITEEEARQIMQQEKLVSLGRMEQNGKPSRDRYLTTEENIKKEQNIIERMKAGKGAIKAQILSMSESRAALDRAEARARAAGKTDFSIADGEQGEAIHHILVSNDKYIGVQGLAGTGKTTLMERLKWIADEQNIIVRGVCFTGKAADGLQNESGIESTTIHSFLNKLEKGERKEYTAEEKREYGREMADPINRAVDVAAKKITEYRRQLAGEKQGIKQEWDFSNVQKAQNREIWIVDEAGLVDNNLMNELQKAAEARGAQIVFSGDTDQLPPVGAGQPMRRLIDEGMGTAYLSNIRRQKDNQELLAAVKESVSGDHLKTFEKLDEMGDYHEIKETAERRDFIMKEMSEGVNIKDYKENLLLVSTNADRKRYNKEIRQTYVERGELAKGEQYKISVHDGDKTYTESRHFAEKDRIIFMANDNRVGVKNGTLAVIDKIDGNQITATTDAGEKIQWDMQKYNSLDHAYAVTNYKAQGMSVGTKEKNEQGIEIFKGKVVCDMSTSGAAQNRNALYVDISRAKTHAVVVTDDKAKLERQTLDFAHKINSDDFKERITEMQKAGIQNNDRYEDPDRESKQALEKALASIEKAYTTPPPPPSVERVREQRAAEIDAERRAELNKTAEKILKTPPKEQKEELILTR